ARPGPPLDGAGAPAGELGFESPPDALVSAKQAAKPTIVLKNPPSFESRRARRSSVNPCHFGSRARKPESRRSSAQQLGEPVRVEVPAGETGQTEERAETGENASHQQQPTLLGQRRH